MSLFNSGLTGLVLADAATAATVDVERGECGKKPVLGGDIDECWLDTDIGSLSDVKARPREPAGSKGAEGPCDSGVGCLLPAAVAAASAPADGFEMGPALIGFKRPGPKADAAPRKAGEDTGEGLGEAIAAFCWIEEGFGATGGRTERFSVINPSTVG